MSREGEVRECVPRACGRRKEGRPLLGPWGGRRVPSGVVTAGAQVVAVRCLHPGWEGVSVCGVRGEVPCRPSESERLNYWENSEVADQFHL